MLDRLTNRLKLDRVTDALKATRVKDEWKVLIAYTDEHGT